MTRKWGRTCALALGLMGLAPAVLGAPQMQAQIDAALGGGNARQAEQLADATLAAGNPAPGNRGLLLLDRGMAREAQGHHDDALVDLTEAIGLHALPARDQAHALFVRGAVLEALGRVADAIGDYSAALALRPRYAPALNNRANAWRRQNRFAEAERDYLASLSAGNLQPEYSYFGLGQIAEAKGNVQGARGFYAQAVAANPDYALAAERLAALGGAPDGAVTTADSGIVHLRPPKSLQPEEAEAVVLRPPGAVHLHPPQMVAASYGPGRSEDKAEPNLRPALDDADRRTADKTGPVTNPSGSQVQLGAWRSEEEAGQGWNSVLKRSGGLLKGLSPRIVAVDLPGKGRYYRLRVGPATESPARFCAALAAQGVDCIPARD